MNNFDSLAREWDNDKAHMERSVAIAAELKRRIPLNPSMTALEFGAGTGILSFLLKDSLCGITLIDNSAEMIRVCAEKIDYYGADHIKAYCLDLTQADLEEKFDCIFTQMVLHHVPDVKLILEKFLTLLNPGGYLAIADLFEEDGSFHGPEVIVHKGFDPEELCASLKSKGFIQADFMNCYEIRRESGRTYPVFLLYAKK
jgi:2-polyprenyl-3-methyl-5-hydroxy-6-metoxy-1,4-benzoquinol methylase